MALRAMPTKKEPAFLRVHGVALPFAATGFSSLHYIGPVNRSFEKHTQSFGPGPCSLKK